MGIKDVDIMGTFTSPDALYKPDNNEDGWGDELRANADIIQTKFNVITGSLSDLANDMADIAAEIHPPSVIDVTAAPYNATGNSVLSGDTLSSGTDDTDAIKAAISAAGTAGTIFFPPLIYKIRPNEIAFYGTQTILANGATFVMASASGKAIVLGGSTFYQGRAFLPRVRLTGTARAASSVGISCEGVVNAEVFVDLVRNFAIGLSLSPTNVNFPNAYSKVFIKTLDSNKQNLYITDASAYSNEFSYFGGNFRYDSGLGTNNTGWHHIKIDQTGSNLPGSHRFYSPSLEGGPEETGKTVFLDECENVTLFDARWELATGITFGASSIRNRVIDGDNVFGLAVVDSGTYNQVYESAHPIMPLRSVSGTSGAADRRGGMVLQNQSSGDDPSISVYNAGVNPRSAVDDWMFRVSATRTTWKAATDTHNDGRLTISPGDGGLYWGSGVGATDTNLRRTNANELKTDDKLIVALELEVDGALNHDGTTVGFFGVTPAVRPSAYTPTNVTPDRAYDANATTTDELADILGTVIADLKTLGILQ